MVQLVSTPWYLQSQLARLKSCKWLDSWGQESLRDVHSHGWQLMLTVSKELIQAEGQSTYLCPLHVAEHESLTLLTWWPRPPKTRVPYKQMEAYHFLRSSLGSHITSNPLKSKTCLDSRGGNIPCPLMGVVAKSYCPKIMWEGGFCYSHLRRYNLPQKKALGKCTLS